jgi:tripartite ATP-independent transporter DctM subunit
MSPELVVLVMFGATFIGILSGYPLAIVLGGVAMFVGLIEMGPMVFIQGMGRIFAQATSYVFLAVPLFIFMGVIVEKSGAAERLFAGLHLAFGKFRGGLAIGAIVMGTIMAATVGVIAASIIMIGLLAIPPMVKRNYDKKLTTGAVLAGGCLGILIPPSVQLVVYGPMAQISVGKLFMGAFGPGLLLSALYIIYVSVLCWIRPNMAPVISEEELAVGLSKKLSIIASSVIPPVVLIMAVLGTIFFGIASPTEAAAIGCVAAIALAAVYRRLNLTVFKEGVMHTLVITCMVYLTAFGAQIFVGVFLKLGGGEVISNLVMAAPGGKWGVFAVIMLIVFLLGFMMSWVGIILVMVPLITPIAASVGFDPVWFALMVCVNLQMSYMTPPMAPAIFYLKGITRPEWGISTMDIIKGVVPFILLVMLALVLCIIFPQIITWLPNAMIK